MAKVIKTGRDEKLRKFIRDELSDKIRAETDKEKTIRILSRLSKDKMVERLNTPFMKACAQTRHGYLENEFTQELWDGGWTFDEWMHTR